MEFILRIDLAAEFHFLVRWIIVDQDASLLFFGQNRLLSPVPRFPPADNMAEIKRRSTQEICLILPNLGLWDT
jgi:hypothetical protein